MSETNEIIYEIREERIRQQCEEGWTNEHDDELVHEELINAAVAYATGKSNLYPYGWIYKPAPRRRRLIKAAALIIAEVERLDRRRTEA